MNHVENGHIPVLHDEVIQGLGIRADGIYVDCTYGRGGHSRSILAQLGPSGRLYVIDRDPDAVRHARGLAEADPRVYVRHAEFSGIGNFLRSEGVAGLVNGILFDLGVSSPQLDNAERGFSFSHDGVLDMRMNPDSGISAADWLATAPESEIARVLKEFGEEKFARRIARAIIHERELAPVDRTGRLAGIIAAAVPVRDKHKHPATRSFQAIRIYINAELEQIAGALQQAYDMLATGGRLAVISFHSLEDRIVKRFMREYSRNDPYPRDIPVTADMLKPALALIGRAVHAGAEEIERNPRARSAVLRIAEKLA